MWRLLEELPSTRNGLSRAEQQLLDGLAAGNSRFGEVFRYLSYLDIGSAAIMSRAAAGTARGKVLISLPGSKGAVTLAMENLILPELRPMVSQVQGN